MFADIRGFTGFSENLSPERVVKALNQHLALSVEAILAEEGTLDKFVGDAVMAFFNAPLPQPDHTLRAVRAAMAMQQAIATYHREMSLVAQPLNFGIGIHVGQAVVGNIGTVQQMNYTIIGDAVNLAKRLQEHAKGGQIILSQAAYTAVKDFITAEDLGLIAVKGRVATEHIYELITLH
jgi:class 3 adenylate cyclase